MADTGVSEESAAANFEVQKSVLQAYAFLISRLRPVRLAQTPSLLYNGYRASFPEVKRPERGVNHPHPSSTEVKERIELYLYSLSGPSWRVLG